LPATSAAAFTGATRVDQGALLLAPGATLGGLVAINAGGIAGGAGTLTGAVTVAASGVLQAGGLATGGTLTLGGPLDLAGAATVNFTLFAASNDQLHVADTVTTTAQNIVAITTAEAVQSGTYYLGNATALAAITNIKLNGVLLDPSLRETGDLADLSGTLAFTYGADTSRYMRWTAASGTWDGAFDNWADYDGGISAPVAGKTKFQNADTVSIASTASGTIAIAAPVIVSDLFVDTASGTLALSGATLTAATTVNGALIAAPAARLVKTGPGTLHLANAADTFTGGIELHAGALAFSSTAQLAAAPGAPAPLAIAPAAGDTVTLRPLADLTLANPITLAPAVGAAAPVGTALRAVRPAASPAPADTATLALEIPAAARVTLTSTISGTGLIAKIGPGALVYSNPAFPAGTAADIATRLDAGVLELRDIAAPADFAHTFILNGGWLDLSANPSAFTDTDATAANDWASLTLVAGDGDASNTSRVIGANDKLTLGAGKIPYRIGGDTDAENGLYVVINATGGTTTFTQENTYAGRTLIESGALSVAADNQLGDTTLARAVILAGGTLQIRSSLDTARRLELTDSGGALDIAAGATATLAGSAPASTTPPATPPTLEKTGPGTLVLSAALAHGGPALVTAGTLRAPGAFLPRETRLADATTLDFAQAADAAFTGTVAAAGATGGLVLKTGPAALTLGAGTDLSAREIVVQTGTLALGNGSAVTARELTLQSGALVLNPAATLALANRLSIAPGAALRGSGLVTAPTVVNRGEIRVGRAAGAATHGTLTIAGDYEGDGGAVHLAVGTLGASGVQADKLVINGQATGATAVHFTQPDGPQPALPSGYGLPDDLISFANATHGAFTQSVDSDDIIFGATEYVWKQDASGNGRWDASTVSEARAATGADAAALLAGKAAAGSLASRLAALRLAGDTGAGPAFWVDGLHRHDRLRDPLYKDATSTLYGVQLGADLRHAKDGHALALGAFYDHAQSRFEQTGDTTTARAENNAGGIYAMAQAGPFHLELLARASSETYRVAATGDPEFRVKGRGFLQSVSAGCTLSATRDWHIEPQFSLSRQRIALDTVTSPAEITYRFDDTKSLEARAAVQIWQDYKRKNGLLVRPRLRLAWLHDFDADSSFTANGERFSTTLGGSACQIDAALDLQLTRRIDATVAAAYLLGSKMESYTATLGLAWHW
jgi:outer membrane autotransporter protein